MSKLTATELANRDLRFHVYHVYVIENTKTGGRYVGVRKNITISALWSLMKVGAKNPNFSMPIHESIREAGDQNAALEDSSHAIRRIATFTSKNEAQQLATKLIEANANKARAYNAQRPAIGASENFEWANEEEAAKIFAEKAKAERLAKKQAKTKAVKPAKVVDDTTENGASA